MAEEDFDPALTELVDWPEAEQKSLLRDPADVRGMMQKVYPLASARLVERLSNLLVQTAEAVVAVEAERRTLTFEDKVDRAFALQGMFCECIRDGR
jgi:hypothetical protein